MKKRIIYLRSDSGQPIGCVAIASEKGSKLFNYQVSVQNPKDKFSKSIARHLAIGRLEEQPICASSDSNNNVHDITSSVMSHIVKNQNMPARAIKSAKIWLKSYRIKNKAMI